MCIQALRSLVRNARRFGMVYRYMVIPVYVFVEEVSKQFVLDDITYIRELNNIYNENFLNVSNSCCP